MARFGIICPPVMGHINPLAAVGRALIRRGHEVTYFHVRDAEEQARREGLHFDALGDREYPVGTLQQAIQNLSKLSGWRALKYSVDCACRVSDVILKAGPDVIRGREIDVLLVDQNEPAGGSVAERLRIPFLSVCTSLPLNREPLIPPPFVGWKFIDSRLAIARNRIGYAVADRLIAPVQAVLNRYRKQWKLPPISQPADTFSKLATIAQMPKTFDFPRRHLPETFHYLGPWFDTRSSSHIHFPFDKLDGRPVVYGSIGTLQGKHSGYFRIMAEACRELDVQLVLSLGHGTGEAGLTLPGNPVIVNYAPQLELLRRASVTITHAGMNTTQQSLHFGIPAVAIPLAHDQPAIAARLSRSGAGITVPTSRLTPAGLRRAVQRVLPEKSEFRGWARQLKKEISEAGGAERAADIAEQFIP